MKKFLLPISFLTLGSLTTLGFQATTPSTAPATEPAKRVLNETVTTSSGLQYKFTQLGEGPAPKPGDLLIIHGIGLYADGKEFWNTRTEKAPYEYTPGVDRVIKGFEEGMHYVHEGDRIVITMKPELGYGARGNGQIPPNSTLVFDYEIHAIKPLSVAKLVREATAAGKLDEELARVQQAPNFHDYYATPADIVSIANRANRTHAGDGEKILTFGMALLPDAYQIPQALARTQAQRGAKEDAVKNYQAALRLNKKDTDVAKELRHGNRSVESLANPELKAHHESTHLCQGPMMPAVVRAPRKMVEAIASLHLPPKADHRLRSLMDRNTNGDLTRGEREELESLVELSEQISLLRADALQLLGRKPA